MLAYSDKPIRLTVKIGAFGRLIWVLFAIYHVDQVCPGEIIVAGYASLIISFGSWQDFSGDLVSGSYVGKPRRSKRGQ